MGQSTITEKQIMAICSRFYDTLLGDLTWEQALEAILPLYRGKAIHLFFLDREKNLIENVGLAGQTTQKALDNYTNYYGKFDPRGQYIAGQQIGSLVSCQEICDNDFVRTNEVYQDHLIPNGLRHTIAATPAQWGNTVAVLGLMRPEEAGAFTRQELQTFAPLMRHLGRALDLQQRFRGLQSKLLSQSQALNALSFGVIVVDAVGRLQQMNREAENILRRLSALTVGQGRLSCNLPSNQNLLLNALGKAIRLGLGGAVFIDDAATERRWHLWISPAQCIPGFSSEPMAVISITSPDQPLSLSQALQKTFAFTAAEMKLAQALMTGHSANEYAELNQVRITTVRTQIRSILEKTGVSRQTDLIRLLLNASLTI